MKKYDLHSIMSAAWKFVRKLHITIAAALRIAWAMKFATKARPYTQQPRKTPPQRAVCASSPSSVHLRCSQQRNRHKKAPYHQPPSKSDREPLPRNQPGGSHYSIAAPLPKVNRRTAKCVSMNAAIATDVSTTVPIPAEEEISCPRVITCWTQGK